MNIVTHYLTYNSNIILNVIVFLILIVFVTVIAHYHLLLVLYNIPTHNFWEICFINNSWLIFSQIIGFIHGWFTVFLNFDYILFICSDMEKKKNPAWMGPSYLNGIILWQIMQSLLVYSIKWNNALWHKLCRIKQAHQQDFMNLWIKEKKHHEYFADSLWNSYPHSSMGNYNLYSVLITGNLQIWLHVGLHTNAMKCIVFQSAV